MKDGVFQNTLEEVIPRLRLDSGCFQEAECCQKSPGVDQMKKQPFVWLGLLGQVRWRFYISDQCNTDRSSPSQCCSVCVRERSSVFGECLGKSTCIIQCICSAWGLIERPRYSIEISVASASSAELRNLLNCSPSTLLLSWTQAVKEKKQWFLIMEITFFFFALNGNVFSIEMIPNHLDKQISGWNLTLLNVSIHRMTMGK